MAHAGFYHDFSAQDDGLGAGSSTEKLNAASQGEGWRPEPPASPRSKRNKPLWFFIILLAFLAIGGAVVGALFAKNVIHVGRKSSTATTAPDSSSSADSGSSAPTAPASGTAAQPTASSAPKVVCTSADDIPSSAKGTWMDPTSWLDLKDFNCTFTDETVGGLPTVGLFSTWDDSKQANANVPPLNKPWGSYGSKPIRGVNLGGWLSLEPFITPSLFETGPFDDEWTLCTKLGPKAAAAKLEKHYSTFITEDDFKSIAAAGLDHVRIPYSYWAVQVYDNDPYVFGVSWRYLLRAIEWARKHGLRVNLDLHAVPGSQNGWNHSGKEGAINWLTGPNGATNAQRTLDLHNKLSKFFAQPRYKNVIAFYGLVNEPANAIPIESLITWTTEAYKIVQGNGVTATQIFSEALRGLGTWQGDLTGYGDSLAIDVHEYTLFDAGLMGLTHVSRVEFACKTWTAQVEAGSDPATGFGPTIVGEWSQADTDCAEYLNGVGNGARWTGTFDNTAPNCPTKNDQCSCDKANADPSTYTPEYKTFLQSWAEAQMYAFEKTWGWFYWTWKTENAPLWSYQAGLEGDFLPPLAYQRSWDCSKSVPSFGDLPEYY